MKSIKILIAIIFISFILTSCSIAVPTVASNSPLPKVTPTETSSRQSPTPTPLITEKPLTKNQIAHEAYENAMRNGELVDIRESAEEYSFYDIDNDGIDELIAYPAEGAETYSIYNFFEGNINELLSIGQAWNSLFIYPEKGAVYFLGTGHMGYYSDVLYLLTNGEAYIAAEHDCNEARNSEKLINHMYTVNGKKTKKAKYNKFIENLATGKEVRHEDLQWYQWVNSESSEFGTSSVLQSNEAETHYFRFDSNAGDTICFHFNVKDYCAKLQNMNITLCDADLKPISKTDTLGTFEQTDYKCTISEEGKYYLKVTSEFKKMNNNDYLDYEVFISST